MRSFWTNSTSFVLKPFWADSTRQMRYYLGVRYKDFVLRILEGLDMPAHEIEPKPKKKLPLWADALDLLPLARGPPPLIIRQYRCCRRRFTSRCLACLVLLPSRCGAHSVPSV